VGLITRRSQVRVLFPLLRKPLESSRGFFYVVNRSLLASMETNATYVAAMICPVANNRNVPP
ncbi:MAG: hypothetical protein ACPGZQ_03175, partial [Flavobacteriaceae bacterium]